jgi:hypothetical protein
MKYPSVLASYRVSLPSDEHKVRPKAIGRLVGRLAMALGVYFRLLLAQVFELVETLKVALERRMDFRT